MAKGKMDLSAFVGKLLEEQDGDTLREGIRALAQALMESEVSGLIGAERYERSAERSSYRNGHRLRSWDTRVGTRDRRDQRPPRPRTFHVNASSVP
jgi:transposase-like protein